MPYPGIEPGSETEKKLERCVEKVLAEHKDEKGFGKSNAIAICRKSMEANTMHGLTLLPVTEADLRQWGHDLAAAALKGELVKATGVVLAHAERNANGDGITPANIATLASTLNGMALDLDHKQTEVIGYFINPRQQNWGDVTGGELATDLVVFAGRFPEASEGLQAGTLYPSIEARSSEVQCSVCNTWFQSTEDYCKHLSPLLMGSKLGADVTRWHKNMRAIGGGAVRSPAGAETTFGNTFMVVAHVTAEELGPEELVRRVRDSFYEKIERAQTEQVKESAPGMYVKEVRARAVIVETPDGLLAYPYSVNEEGEVEFGTPQEVEHFYRVKGAMAPKSPYGDVLYRRDDKKAGKETIDVLASQPEVIMPDELKEAREQLDARTTELAAATTRIEELEATNTELAAQVQEHVTQAAAFVVKSRVATLEASGMTEESLKLIKDQLADMDDNVFDLLAEMQKELSAEPAEDDKPEVEAGQLTIGDEDSDVLAEDAMAIFDVEVIQ